MLTSYKLWEKTLDSSKLVLIYLWQISNVDLHFLNWTTLCNICPTNPQPSHYGQIVAVHFYSSSSQALEIYFLEYSPGLKLNQVSN